MRAWARGIEQVACKAALLVTPCVFGPAAYDLAKEDHVLTADDIQPQWYVSIALIDDDPLHRLLQDDVCKLIERSHDTDDLAAIAKLNHCLGCGANTAFRQQLNCAQRNLYSMLGASGARTV